MTSIEAFGLDILVAGGVLAAAILSNRVSARIRLPSAAIFLLAAAAATDLLPSLPRLSIDTVEQVVTVALVVILFDGGMGIGLRRFRRAAGPATFIGVVGTSLTAGALAALAHLIFGFDWLPALLIGTALAPTDPAVVFSVLGGREISGRSGTLLEAEAGLNDPVGIALLVALLGTAGTAGMGSLGGAARDVVVGFVIQMAVGGVIGVVGGKLLLVFMRRVPLPGAGLYPLRVFAGALVLYGAATVAHGSGFLAVFVAGVFIGDARAPYKLDIERFHNSLASLAEIVAFIMLGLTVNLDRLGDGNAWIIGLVLAALLAFVVRPVLVGLLLSAVRLRWGERAFILFSGLKGAVPILLGAFVVLADLPDASRIYLIIFVAVAFSVIVQGSLVPSAARLFGVPMRTVEPEPWTLGLRLRHEPQGARRYHIGSAAAADGCSIEDLQIDEDVWISLVLREGEMVQVRGDTVLRAGDEVLVLADPEHVRDLERLFTEGRDR